MTNFRLVRLGIAVVLALVAPNDANGKGAGGGRGGGGSGKASSHGPVKVSGYVKSNGTYVAPHWRDAPDGTPWNNWSTIGNVNPFTGKPGTHWPSVSGNAGNPSNAASLSGYSPGEEPSQSWAVIPRPLTYTEQKWRDQEKLFKRVITAALDAEITSGKAHNVILEVLALLTNEGAAISGHELDPVLLKGINVSVGASGHHVGIFKDGAYMDWPIALRGPTQRALSAALGVAVHAATTTSFELAHYTDLKKRMSKLEDELRKKFHKEEIDATLFLGGRRFLESLDGAVRSLQEPAVQNLLADAYQPSGTTVGELLLNMKTRGLKFAPAVPGREGTYVSLYAAFVRYAKATMEATGSGAASKGSNASMHAPERTTLMPVVQERKGDHISQSEARVHSVDRSTRNPGASASPVVTEPKGVGLGAQDSTSTGSIEPKLQASTPSAPQAIIVIAPSVTVINNNGEQSGFPWLVLLLIFTFTTPLLILGICVFLRVPIE